MPRATLSFKLPEEQEEYAITNNALNYKCVVDDILGFLRRKIKYEHITDTEQSIYEDVRTELLTAMDEHGLEA